MSQLPGTNAKMSEYHAAVGLASLDRWRDMRQDYMNLALAYSEALSASNCARLQPGFGHAWLAGTCIAQLDDEQVDAVAARLTAANIETRQWWERGAHSHPATSHLPRGNLATTDRLSRSTIGLPFHLNLKRADIERVVDVMRMAVS
jgi:dTDP-4-amino-4,6-dideoxygalactose transaminase